MINEFKAFIARGNVVDMAVGIIIGAAFTAIVTSMVSDLINPIIALVTGGIDFSGWFYALDGTTYASLTLAQEAGALVDGVREGQDPLESGSLLCANNAIFDGFAKVIRDV